MMLYLMKLRGGWQMKTTMRQKIVYLILFLSFLTVALPGEKALADAKKNVRIVASKGQKKKIIKISSKKQLIKSLDENLIKRTREISYQIDRKHLCNRSQCIVRASSFRSSSISSAGGVQK